MVSTLPMRRSIGLALVTLAAATQGCAECADERCDGSPLAAAPIWPGRQAGFLWVAERADASVYLLGTIHVGVDPAGFPATVHAILDGAPTLVTEADTRTPIPRDVLDRHSLLPEGMRLDELLSPEAYRDLSAQYAYNDPLFWRREPFYVYLLRTGGLNRDLPRMDDTLLSLADTRGAQLRFMETSDDALAALAATPRSIWLEDLEWLVRDPGGYQADLQTLIEAYLRRDTSYIRGLAYEGGPAYNDPLLRDRNLRWLPKIDDWQLEDGTVVAAGLAHFIGPNNLLDLLRTSGSTVSAVRLDGRALSQRGQTIGALPSEPRDTPSFVLPPVH